MAAALWSIVVAAGSSTAWAVADPAPIVAGVSEVVSVGALGPIFPLDEEWVPVVGGDDDTTFPHLLVVAREYGAGRVVAFGHGGILVETGVLDNGLFTQNLAAWLDVSGGKRIGYTTGHGEWLREGGPSGWAAVLAPHGYTAVAVPGELDAGALAGVDVLLVGDAWGEIQPAEAEAVRQWVEAGHGLMMVGLGWSWDAYHPGEFESFPMHLLAAPYGVRWARGGIWDPTDNLDGSPVFHTFYPDVPSGDRASSIGAIDDAHLAHGSALPAVLESDADERLAFVRAHQTLAFFCRELPLGHPLRQAVFDDLAGLAAREPFYRRIGPFDEATEPTAAWVRERMLRGWIDCLGLPPPVRVQIADALQMTGARRDVLVELGVALHDNDRMEAWHLEYIRDFLTLVPEGLTDLRAITVAGLLGVPPMPVGLDGTPQGFNIWVSDAAFDQFPPDVPPGIANDTAVVIAHELNHQVNAHTIGPDPVLQARQQQLIADAGNDPLNYLRSMIGAGFFVQNPQEFFASMANQWFVDSAKTVDLGIIRFDAGRPDPINQALFFAEVYSQGTDTTWFYTTDTTPITTRRPIVIHRNADGWIDEIEGSEHRYRFTLDAAGRVTGYAIVDDSCAAPLSVGRGRIDLSRIDGVDGNDSVTLSGRATFPEALDPVANGLRVYLSAPSGELFDVFLPAGAYDPVTRTGWRGNAKKWTFSSAALIEGVIDRATVRTSNKGETRFKLSGRKATVATDLPELPLSFTLVTDPVGTCARAEFPGPAPLPRCSVSGTRVKCR